MSTTTTTKPTIVIIHGAWHLPIHYAKLTSALRAAGYSVHIPRLPSTNGARPPDTSLAGDSIFIRTYVEQLLDEGHNILALMHSYGGQAGTNALYDFSLQTRSKAGKSGALTHLLYMCAYAQPVGASVVDKAREFDMEHLFPIVFDIADDETSVIRDPKAIFFEENCGVDETEMQIYNDSLVRWNGGCLYQPAEHCAWMDEGVEVGYLVCPLDLTVPLGFQNTMIEGMRKVREVRTWEVQTGHIPHVTRTGEVVRIVGEILGVQ